MRIRTLDRYIGMQFLKMFALCLFGFIMIYTLVDFIERSSQIFKEQPSSAAIFLYFLYKMPLIIFQMIPIACLLGSLLSLVMLAKNSEIVAIKAGGIPLLRATASIIVLSSIISVAAFLMNEYVVPYANEKKDYIYLVEIKKHEWRIKYRKQNVYYKSGRTIFSFGLFVPEQNKVSKVRMYRFDEKFRLVERAVAEKAEYGREGWSLINGIYWRFDGESLAETKSFDTMPANLIDTPDEMKVYQKESEQMSYRELKAFIKDMRRLGYDTTAYQVDLAGKLSFPLVPIIMAVLGIPFAARVGRSGGIALGIGVAVVIGVVYWIILGIGLALGHSGALPSFVAAWGSHIFFGALGFAGLMKVRQ
jgi:lipopolysaccharide export system permease protein